MNVYGILTRYGDYFEVTAASVDDARDQGGMLTAQHGDSVQQVEKIADPIQGIRDDLAEIMAR